MSTEYKTTCDGCKKLKTPSAAGWYWIQVVGPDHSDQIDACSLACLQKTLVAAAEKLETQIEAKTRATMLPSPAELGQRP